MDRLNHQLPPKTETDLQKLDEPLASYICADDCPWTVLLRTSYVRFSHLSYWWLRREECCSVPEALTS